MERNLSAISIAKPALKSSVTRWPLLVLAAILLLVTLIRLRLAPSPLERDEGEYAFIGQLMLQGIPPYTEAANMKFPGTYASYAIIEAVFGQTSAGIHHGLLVVNLATILLVYHIGCRFLIRRHIAVMAAAIYAVTSLSYSFFGAMAHATHFVVFFGLSGLALLFVALKRNSIVGYTLAGVITGLAYVAKQSGFYFVPFGCLLVLAENKWLLFSPPVLRGLAYFIAGAFAPFAIIVYIFQQLGCLDNFVFWTFRYAFEYGTTLQQAPHWLYVHFVFILEDGFAWIFFPPSLLFFLPIVWRKSGLSRRTLVLLSLFLALSFAGVALGFYFRNHYWIQALPAVALLSAVFLSSVASSLCRPGSPRTPLIASVLCLCCCSVLLIGESPRFFRTAPDQIIREIYWGSQFTESVVIGDYIQRHSKPEDIIFVFGSEPQIYFYAKRHAAASNLYLYPLLETHPYRVKMQRTLVSEVDQCRPRYFIEAHEVLMLPEMESRISLYQWKNAFLTELYRPVLMLDLNHAGNTMIFGDAVLSHTCVSGRYITIWEKRL